MPNFPKNPMFQKRPKQLLMKKRVVRIPQYSVFTQDQREKGNPGYQSLNKFSSTQIIKLIALTMKKAKFHRVILLKK